MPINTHITPPITENERIAAGLQSGKRGKNDEARLTNECGSDLRFTCRAVTLA